MTDLTRTKNFAEKKTVSWACARVVHGDVADTAQQDLFNLPENCVIMETMVNVEVAGQGGLTVNFGFDGAAELGSALVMSAVAVIPGLLPAVTGTVTTLTGTIDTLTGTISDLTGLVDTLTGTVTALTLTEGTPNTLDSGTIALTSGALTLTSAVTTLDAAAITLTSGALTGTVTPAPRLATGTGKLVTAKFSADPSAGSFVFMVGYIEYDLGNGKLTNYS